jgi:hypothetical protein
LNAVQQVSAAAELHDGVHEERVLVCAGDADDAGVIGSERWCMIWISRKTSL